MLYTLSMIFWRPFIILIIIFTLSSFYVSVFLFGDLKEPIATELTDLDRCPACYGISMCPELYSGQIILETKFHQKFFNAKNIYYGHTKASNRKIVLKKLAHDSELSKFDSELCSNWNLPNDCRSVDLLNVTNARKNILQIVKCEYSQSEATPRSGLIFCPYAEGIFEFVKPLIDTRKGSHRYKTDLINIWTMLKLNAEPIIIQAIPKSKGYPVPAYEGVCGRLELVANEGVTLSSIPKMDLLQFNNLTYNMLQLAMECTFKHERYRFYILDWSYDNIVINDKGELTFVDLEDVVVLDTQIKPGRDVPNWYTRHLSKFPGKGMPFSFSVEDIGKHFLSDHNFHGVCHTLLDLCAKITCDQKLYEFFKHCVSSTTDRIILGASWQLYLHQKIYPSNNIKNIISRVHNGVMRFWEGPWPDPAGMMLLTQVIV